MASNEVYALPKLQTAVIIELKRDDNLGVGCSKIENQDWMGVLVGRKKISPLYPHCFNGSTFGPTYSRTFFPDVLSQR